MVEISGQCEARFNAVKDLMAQSIAAGDDIGASFAVSLDGEMVVDLWGGTLDAEGTQAWQQDTIVNVYSTTKPMSFLCALVLASRGLLDFDENVALYWPEFAENGKEEVKVWHVMNHAAGLSGMDVMVTPEEMYDWDKMTSLLAAQAPWWEPGSAVGYHAITQGYLIGEIIRRISGKTLGQFFRDEIATPLAADFHIGVPESEFPRIGNLTPLGDGEAEAIVDSASIAARTFRSPFSPARYSWTDDFRRAELPALNGHGNARSVVRTHTPLACGGSAFGVDLVAPQVAKAVMTPRISGHDMVLQIPVQFGLGYGIVSDKVPLAPNKNTCFWGGWGGSLVVVDQDARLCGSFVMNKMGQGTTGDMRAISLLHKVFAALAD